jgi:hypothetical protein
VSDKLRQLITQMKVVRTEVLVIKEKTENSDHDRFCILMPSFCDSATQRLLDLREEFQGTETL